MLAAITSGIHPYAGHAMGWSNPTTYLPLIAGVALLALFALIERGVPEPMIDLNLLRIRPFAAGVFAAFAAAIARGGLQLMLVIWLQGIWLPLHGFSFEETPLWAGIYLLPLSAGFMLAGPLAGHLSDRFGARRFSTAGLLVSSSPARASVPACLQRPTRRP